MGFLRRQEVPNQRFRGVVLGKGSSTAIDQITVAIRLDSGDEDTVVGTASAFPQLLLAERGVTVTYERGQIDCVEYTRWGLAKFEVDLDSLSQACCQCGASSKTDCRAQRQAD